MKKIILMIFLLMTGIVLMAQTGTGWSQQRSKVNFKDSINIAKAWMIDGTAITPSAEELNYVNDLTSNAQDQLDALSADVDTLQTDTVDIDDVALQLYQYALEPADSTADSTVNYVTHTQNDADSILYKNDTDLFFAALGYNYKGQSLGCDLKNATTTNVDLSDNVAVYGAVYIRKADSITGAIFISKDNGSFNQTEFNGIALFTYGSDDTLRQVAISANDSTKWETADGSLITFPFTSKYYATPGLYYLGILHNCAGTASTVPEIATSVANSNLGVYKASFYVLTENVFPAKFKRSVDSYATQEIKWFVLY